MQLDTRDGIACDYCGIKYQLDFTYYSADFRLVPVFGGRKPLIASILTAQPVSSFDICTNCYSGLSKTIVANYTKNMSSKSAKTKITPNVVLCELTGNILTGDFDFYYCDMSSIKVLMSNQPKVCSRCKTTTNDNTCKCGGVVMRTANVQRSLRVLEFSVSDAAYREFIKKIETVRKTAGEWSTR